MALDYVQKLNLELISFQESLKEFNIFHLSFITLLLMCYHFQPRARKSRSWNRFYAKGILKCILHEITTEQCLCMVLCYYSVKTICVVCQKLLQHLKFNEVHPKRSTEKGFYSTMRRQFLFKILFSRHVINYENNHNDFIV